SSTGAPLRISGGNYHVISHNTFRNTSGWVLRALTGDNIRFVHNDVYNVGTGNLDAILAFQGNSNDCLVMGNTFSNVRTSAGSASFALVHFQGTTGNGNQVIG